MRFPSKTDQDVGFFGQRAVDEADDRAAQMSSGFDTGSEALNDALDALREIYELNPNSSTIYEEAITAVLDAAKP